jgi:hypothetical protein
LKNFLTTSMFKMSFDSARFKDNNFSDYIVSTNVPGMQLGLVSHGTNIRSIERPGDSVIFNDLSIEFLISEDMNSWFTIYNWLNDLRNFNDHGFDNSIVTDCTLIFLTNKANTNKGIVFKNIFPYNLSDFQMDLQETDMVGIRAEATFKYQSYEFLEQV